MRNDSLMQFTKHATLGSCTQHPMVLEDHVSQKVYALCVFTYVDFAWMQTEIKMRAKEGFNRLNKRGQIRAICRYDCEIVCISKIVTYLQIVLDELIKRVEIHIGKQLRGEITDGQTLMRIGTETRSGETVDDFIHQPQNTFVPYTLGDLGFKNGMRNRIEELVDVALQNEASASVVPALLPQHSFQCVYCLMRSFALSAGEGMRDKRRLKDGIESGEHGMMDNTIPHGSFVDVSPLWIADPKSIVWTVFVPCGTKFPVQSKDVCFDILVKFLHIQSGTFTFLESFPCAKKRLGLDDGWKDVVVVSHTFYGRT